MGEVQIEVLKSLVAERFGVDIRLDAAALCIKRRLLLPLRRGTL